jgi:hypothetical protein
VNYYDKFVLTVEKVNLAILALLEEQRIDPLAYTLFGSIGSYRQKAVGESSGSDGETIGALLGGERQTAG